MDKQEAKKLLTKTLAEYRQHEHDEREQANRKTAS